jgi:IS30 family transposase
MISERPPEIADRAVPGHWEGDLILGLGSSAIGTLVERTTRFTMLLHLPRMEGYRPEETIKNGPPLAGHGAEAVREAIAKSLMKLPDILRQSLTWDQGAEMAQHARLHIDTGLEIYFCDPQSPWQRGTNENTNGLLRQYFPKGTDLSWHTSAELDAVAHAVNTRPRKTLGWKTPAEALDQLLADVYIRVLRRPVESAQHVSIKYTERLAEAGIKPSVSSVGDSYDNALAETINGLYKAEVIHRRGP